MSKYKAGDKFIIEIEDVLHIESDKGLWVEPWYMVNGMEGTYFEEDDLDGLDRYDEADEFMKDYSCGHRDGYSQGYRDGAKSSSGGVWDAGYTTGYGKGLQERWKEHKEDCDQCSKGYRQQIEDAYTKGLNDAWECVRKIRCSVDEGERKVIFGTIFTYDILKDNTASEAIEKLREYEANKDKIKVGDEVRLKDLGFIGVVTRLADLEQAACIMFDDGSATWKSLNGAKKTGRYFPIEDILEQMRSE